MSVIENMVIHIDIDQSETGYSDTWWSIPAEKSADLFHEYENKVAQVKMLLVQMRRAKKQRTENDEDDIETEGTKRQRDNALVVTVQFEWEWPEGKKGTKIVNGQATNFSSYTLNFDTMEQKNNDTGFVRKFRVVNVLLPVNVTASDEEAFDASIANSQPS